MSQRLAEPLRASGFAGALDVGEEEHALGPRKRHVRAAAGEMGGAAFCDPIEAAAVRRRLQQRRHLPALCGELLCKPVGADRVDHLERPALPGVAEAHCAIDRFDIVGNLGHQPGGVGERARHHLPGVGAGLVRMLEQRPERAARLLDALEPGAPGRPVIAGGEVAHLLLFLLGAGLQPVEAALALAADIAALDHLADERGFVVDRVEGIALRQRIPEAAPDQRHQVESDQIDQPEDAGLRHADGAAQHRVGLLHRHPALDRCTHGSDQPVGADAVGDEAGRVVAGHHTLAELAVGEVADLCHDLCPGLWPRHHLQEPHVARRVEEVGDEEVPRERIRHPAEQHGGGNGRRVGGDDCALFAHRIDLAVDGLLGVHRLDHRLDDPVRIAQEVQVVLDIAGGDALGVGFLHEGRGVRLEHPGDGALGQRVPVARAVRHDIEQHHIVPGIGDVGGDAAAHQTRPDDGGLLDRHQAASSTVEMPWPPPMHWVASA